MRRWQVLDAALRLAMAALVLGTLLSSVHTLSCHRHGAGAGRPAAGWPCARDGRAASLVVAAQRANCTGAAAGASGCGDGDDDGECRRCLPRGASARLTHRRAPRAVASDVELPLDLEDLPIDGAQLDEALELFGENGTATRALHEAVGVVAAPLAWWFVAFCVLAPLASLIVWKEEGNRFWPLEERNFDWHGDGLGIRLFSRRLNPVLRVLVDWYWPVFDALDVLASLPIVGVLEPLCCWRPWRTYIAAKIDVHAMSFHERTLTWEGDFCLVWRRWKRRAVRQLCTLGLYGACCYRNQRKWLDSRIAWTDTRRRVEPKILDNQEDFVIFRARPSKLLRLATFLLELVTLGLAAACLKPWLLRRTASRTVVGGRHLDVSQEEFPRGRAARLAVCGRWGSWWVPLWPITSFSYCLLSVEDVADSFLLWRTGEVKIEMKGQLPRVEILTHDDVRDRVIEYKADRAGARRISRMDIPRFFVPAPKPTGPRTDMQGRVVKEVVSSPSTKALYEQYGGSLRVGNAYHVVVSEAALEKANSESDNPYGSDSDDSTASWRSGGSRRSSRSGRSRRTGGSRSRSKSRRTLKSRGSSRGSSRRLGAGSGRSVRLQPLDKSLRSLDGSRAGSRGGSFSGSLNGSLDGSRRGRRMPGPETPTAWDE